MPVQKWGKDFKFKERKNDKNVVTGSSMCWCSGALVAIILL